MTKLIKFGNTHINKNRVTCVIKRKAVDLSSDAIYIYLNDCIHVHATFPSKEDRDKEYDDLIARICDS